MKQLILSKIEEYNRIFIFRHIRADGDCMGASKGLKDIIKTSFPEKEVYIIDNECPAYLAFLGPDDEPVSDELYKDALGIIVDTGTEDRISNKKYALCRETIKIDHHIPLNPYGDYMWVEEECPSCCELITDLYLSFPDKLKISNYGATCLYTGMVTDTGRFRFSGVNGDTMRRAGALLDVGIDTQWLYANLNLEDFNYYKFKAYIYENMKITENGVAYIFVDKEMQKRFNLTQEEASACISALEGIRGSLCWLAFIDNNDEKGSIRVRLRSRFMTVNQIGEKYRGGGHAQASGGTVYSIDEINALIADADKAIKEYKETHEGWL